MKLIDNINNILGSDIGENLSSRARLKIAASYFSIYAYAALKKELEKIQELQFVFTSPTFVADNVTDKLKKEKREFVIPKQDRESSLYGTEFEIHLKNQLSQKAIAKECADWIRRKAVFKSNNSNAPMQEFISIQKPEQSLTYMPIQGFTPMGLGFEKGNAISNMVNCFDEQPMVQTYIQLFNQIWNDPSKVEDVTSEIIRHIESVYQENPPERIYYLMLYNIFKDFLEDINADVMPNDLTGYQDTLVWNKLFNFQKDAAVGIINKLETYNGCILADSVGLGKTFTALAVIKYYELRNKSVLVLCPKKLGANWTNYNANLVTNIFAKDRFSYDVLYHTDLSRKGGETLGIDLAKINWGNYDLVVIDESHNFRNRGTFKDRETRYDRLMNQVIRQGVKTKVLMLSATPVNNHFTDLFYEQGKANTKIEQLFVDQVENIRWAYKLASSTIHLQDQEDLKEIQIFRVKSRVEDLDVSILSFIDKLILTPIIFEVVYQDKVKVVASYKRLSQADKTKAVIGQYYASEWLEDHNRVELPLYLKLADLYEHFIAQILPIASSKDLENDDESVSIELQLQKAQQLESLQKQLAQLQSKLRHERQFNRRVELNKQLQNLQLQINLIH